MTFIRLTIVVSMGLASLAPAALVVTNSVTLEATGNTTVTGGTAQNTSVVSTPLTNNKGTVGEAEAEGEALIQVAPPQNPQDFSFSLSEPTRATIERTVSRGSPASGNSTASHTLTFLLGLNEQMDLVFDMKTAFENQSLDGEVSWGLIGPSGEIADLSGSVTEGGDITQQTTTLTEAGSYTFMVIAVSNPDGARLNSSGEFSIASIETLTLVGISNIPEPGTLFLACLGMTALTSIRRR